MSKKRELLSEAEELDSFLARLESVHEVKEIAGWESGFPGLSRVLNGISPGLYLLVGPPACGKSAFAKQLCDQVARHNSVPAVFFAFGAKKADLRIRTLARLSGLESREIRRGSGYLLHWYGAPKRPMTQADQMPASWEKLKKAAEEAKNWLDLLYVFECDERTAFSEIEQRIRAVREIKGSSRALVVIDDSQRLGESGSSLESRLPLVVERLHGLALRLDLPLLATWPDLRPAAAPQEWAERVAGADVVIVMAADAERTKQLTEPKQAITLHIVKNRGGEKATLLFEFTPALSQFTE